MPNAQKDKVKQMSKRKKSSPPEIWKPENWDQMTLEWLKSPNGAKARTNIAAAPRLLASLFALVSHPLVQCGADDDPSIAEIVTDARAAIALARGDRA